MLSRIAYMLCVVSMLYASFVFYPRWKHSGTEAAISWDVSGYYWYLPSIFIYKDLKHQGFKDSVLQKYQPTGTEFQQGFRHENSNYVMKYSAGASLMYLPFFALAHWLARTLGFPADGFSAPYQFALQAGGLLFSLIGLWYFRKLLRLFYNDTVTAICLLLLVIGTNYLNYAAIDTGMPHAWLFTIYVFILLQTYHFYRSPSYKYALRIGLLCGLATLTRPTDIISILIPLLWGLESIRPDALKKHLVYLWRQRRYIIVCAVCAVSVFSIQLIYWKYATGHWLVYSYQDQGFTWLHPHIKKYLISARNGWLAYAPLMGFAFIGLLPFLRSGRHRVAVLCFILVDLYIVSSWEFFWYGGRFMVQAYPVLFLPLGCFIDWMLQKRIRTWIATPLLLLCAYIGLWTNIQYHYGEGGLYDFDTSPRQYYLAVVGRWHVPEETFKLKDTDELFKGRREEVRLLYRNGFEADTNAGCGLPPIVGRHSLCLSEVNNREEFFFSYSAHNAEWLRAEASFRCLTKEWNVWDMTQFIVYFFRDGREVKSRLIRVYRFLNDGETKRIYMDTRIPNEDFDQVKIAFWQAGSKKTLMIDDLKISTFKGN